MANLAIAVNLNGARPSQYLGFDFKSLTVFNGKVVAAGDDGIFELTGDTDDGSAIDAYVTFPSLNFGTFLQKILYAMRINYESAGRLQVSFIPDEMSDRERSVVVSPIRPGQVSQAQLKGIPRAKDDAAAHWQVKIANMDGVDFSLNALDLILTPLRRHNGT